MGVDHDPAHVSESPFRTAVENTSKYLLGDLGCERTGELQSYLTVVAQFPTLSVYNHHLIFAQCREATVLAAYEDWNTWGYSIKAKARSRKLWDGARFAPYFDESQVMARPDAQSAHLITHTEPPTMVLERLTGILQEEGIDWRDYVSDEMGLDATFHRLIAGCAVAQLDEQPYARALKGRLADCHVEAVTSVVSRYFGFAPMPLIHDIDRWGSSPRALREELEVVRLAAGTIIRLLDGEPAKRRVGPPHMERQR